MNIQRTSHGLAGASLTVLALSAAFSGALSGTAAHAQAGADAAAISSEEIIVTARRKDERLQDVPTTINAVTSEAIEKLNLRDFRDIQTVVPGLSLSSNANGLGTASSVRGINYDVNASGNNGTIEFYLNDAPISSGALFQSMFDIGQIEVLRGPQGTLRGRASPSGSITITTRKPNLREIGGYASATGNDIGGINVNGAVNLPIVDGVLAVRIAGLMENNEGNRVHSINGAEDPSNRTRAVRLTARFEPTDNLSFLATYQRLNNRSVQFDHVESAILADPTASATPTTGALGSSALINAGDRLAVADRPRVNRQQFEMFNWQGEYRLLGQKLNYVGSVTKQDIYSFTPTDSGDLFGPTFPGAVRNFGQNTHTQTQQESHELRLSSEEQLFGMVDYVVGAFVNRLESPSDLVNDTVVFSGTPSTTNYLTTARSPIARRGRSIERSLFGNATLHLGDAAEVSGGVRYINYKTIGSLNVSGRDIAAAQENDNFNTVIYSASAKYRFSDAVMVYASTGSSWRPGINVVGDFNPTRTALEQSFLRLAPEKSKSYEIGVKTNWLDNRLVVNLSGFHQTFDNYPYRVPGKGVYYINASRGPAFVDVFNFVGAVPVEVNGVELESNFRASRSWNMGLQASYAKGRVKNGVIPCNDYNPANGVPDAAGGPVPGTTVVGGRTVFAANGDVVSGCSVNYRPSFAPLFSATAQSEYSRPITDSYDGYVRGLLSYYGASQNDPANSLDDVKAYALLNLYAGVRDPNGAWEVALYGKNVTGTKRVLSRGSVPLTTGYAVGATGVTGTSAYRDVSYTAPSEFGVTARFAFGSR